MPIVEAFTRLLSQAPAELVAWTGNGWRTRAELAAVADRFGQQLAGVPRGGRIALSVRDGFQFLAALLAAWRHEAAAVLLDAADPRAPRWDQALACGADVLLADSSDGTCQRPPSQYAGSAPRPAGGFAAIKLTSGSSGLPRGVGVGFRQLVADTTALERCMGIGPADTVLAAVPMSFSYGVGSIAIPALLSGRRLVIPQHDDPLAVLTALAQGEPTVLPTVPAFVRALAERRHPLPASLRLVISAGARLEASLAERFRRRFGQAVHVFYGATECGGITYDRAGDAAERGTVGTAIDGVQVSLDANGRVRVRSPAVATAIEPDDGCLAGGEYLTPDLGEWRAGELVLLGRVDDVIDVGGHKVQPQEVERVIAGLAGVVDTAVLPWRPAAGREGCAALVAGEVDAAAVRRHCAAQLPGDMIPRWIVIVRELPRSARGKLQRDQAERLLAGHDGAMESTNR